MESGGYIGDRLRLGSSLRLEDGGRSAAAGSERDRSGSLGFSRASGYRVNENPLFAAASGHSFVVPGPRSPSMRSSKGSGVFG